MATTSVPTERSPLPDAADVHIRTWEALKREIDYIVADARALERNTLLLCGGIWAYLAGVTAPVPPLFWNVPIFLASFGALRVLTLMISINPRADYLRDLEKKSLAGTPIKGWEEYRLNHYRRGVGISMIGFWIVLLAATVYMSRLHPALPTR